MPKDIFDLLTKKSSPQTLAQKIKTSDAMSRASGDNPELVLAIAKAGGSAADRQIVTDDYIEDLIRSDAELKLAAEDNDFKRDFSDLIKGIKDEVVIVGGGKTKFPGGETSAGSAVDTKPQAPSASGGGENAVLVKPSSEIYRKLREIVDQIPGARPGAIITDEHHNKLNSAVRAITALLGEIDEAERLVLNIPPYLLPTLDEEADENAADWLIGFNKALVPREKNRESEIQSVRGAMILELPDKASIKKIILRGRRIGDKSAPKACAVHVIRLPHDAEKELVKRTNFTLFETLVSFDLKQEKDFFALSASPDKKFATIDNTEFQYFVSAVWEGKKETDRYEIYGLQIFGER